MTYAANDKVSFMVGLVNGWNNVDENNTGKTFMASVTLKPTGNFSLIENYIGGPETAAPTTTTRNLSDTVLTFTAGRKCPSWPTSTSARRRRKRSRARRLPKFQIGPSSRSCRASST